MKNLLLLVAIGLFCTHKSHAQEFNVFTTQKGQKITQVHRIGQPTEGFLSNSMEEYKGSAFFSDEPQSAIFSFKGKVIEAPIIYIPIQEMFVASVNGEQHIVTNTNFTLGEHHFIVIRGKYYELLQNGKVKILKKYADKVRSLSRGRGGLYVGGSFEGELVRTEIYFLEFLNGRLEEIELNNNYLEKVFAKENAKLAENLRNNKQIINTIEDLKKVLNDNFN